MAIDEDGGEAVLVRLQGPNTAPVTHTQKQTSSHLMAENEARYQEWSLNFPRGRVIIS